MESATGLCNERLFAINRNHFEIVKPADRDADSYRSLLFAFNESARARATGPRVYVHSMDASNGLSCLRFAFSHLPEEFVLDRIRLKVLGATGPTQITVHQAAKIMTISVDQVIDERVFLSYELPDIPVGAQATLPNDSIYVDYCPVLRRKGYRGTLTVRPEFLDLSQEPIHNLNVLMAEEGNRISFDVIHPNNIRIHNE